MSVNVPVSNSQRLEGKVAIVTGAARGVGLATCKSLANLGCNIIMSDILPMDESKIQVENIGIDVDAIKCDISDEADINKLVDYVIGKYNQIDILVHCSGVCWSTPILEETVEEWEKMMRINLTGTFMICKEVFKHQKKQQSGKIVCIGSIAGETGGIWAGTHYVASKGGVHSFVRNLALSAAPHGINVNGIAPGPLDSNMTKGVSFDLDKFPLKRLGEPEDIAEAATFLSSQSSNWITGQILNVNGGLLM